MWIIKGIDSNTSKEKIFKKGFDNEYEANDYIDEHYKDIDGIWVEEAEETINYDVSQYLNKWIWIYSHKMKAFMPYGILIAIQGQFTRIKTREESLDEDLSELRIIKIKEMIENNKLMVKDEGLFIDIKKCF